MTLLHLLWSFFQVGLFSIGGGYAAMPLIQSQVVDQYGWLTMQEFTDLITIAEMTPGPIAVNSATFVGIRMAGIPGALVATMGCILPSLIIVSLLSWLYEKYRSMDAMQAVLACLRPAVVALIASAALTILRVVVFAGGVVSAEAPQAAVYGLCVADPFAWMSADAVLCIPLIKNIMRENYDYLYGSGQKLIER